MRELTFDEMAEIRGGWSKADTENVTCSLAFAGFGSFNGLAIGVYYGAIIGGPAGSAIGAGVSMVIGFGGSILSQALTGS